MASKSLQALKPGMWLNATQRLETGVWPWNKGVRARLPRHYKVQYVESFMKEPDPVHYRKEEGKWKLDKWGQRVPIQNIPIPVKYPAEADGGLWGGEGVIEGLRKKNNDPIKCRYPHIWRPQVLTRTFYSEILDRYLHIPVTRRTLEQIDEHYGFDAYVIKTHQVNLKSKLGMKLKREMLIRLAMKSFMENDQARRDELCEKYQEYIVPNEEAEWLGLTIEEAEVKQERLEEDDRIANTKPLKYEFMAELVHQLKAKDETITPVEDSEAQSGGKIKDKIKRLKEEREKYGIKHVVKRAVNPFKSDNKPGS